MKDRQRGWRERGGERGREGGEREVERVERDKQRGWRDRGWREKVERETHTHIKQKKM